MWPLFPVLGWACWTRPPGHLQGAQFMLHVQLRSSTPCAVAETSNRETKHHTRRVGELRFITSVGPEELTLQALSPKQRGYRVFIHGQAWLSGSVGWQGLGNCKEQDKGEWDKLQFLVLWVPTFWDLRDPDFARSKLSYRGRRSRRLCKILNFPLQSGTWDPTCHVVWPNK